MAATENKGVRVARVFCGAEASSGRSGRGAFQLWEKPLLSHANTRCSLSLWTHAGNEMPQNSVLSLELHSCQGWGAGDAGGRHTGQWACNPWGPMGTLTNLYRTPPPALCRQYAGSQHGHYLHHTHSVWCFRATSMTVMDTWYYEVLSQGQRSCIFNTIN